MAYALTSRDQQSLNSVAARLGTSPTWLYNLIFFETAGTNDPKKGNLLSSAKGLIQFLDGTARSLGFASSADLVNKYPTYSGQLEGPVYRYLSQYAPFNSPTDLYMTVFFPAARNFPPDTSFKIIFQKLYPTTYAEKYNAFRLANPLIGSPADYASLLEGRPLRRTLGQGALVLAAIGGLYFWLT